MANIRVTLHLEVELLPDGRYAVAGGVRGHGTLTNREKIICRCMDAGMFKAIELMGADAVMQQTVADDKAWDNGFAITNAFLKAVGADQNLGKEPRDHQP